MKDLQKHFLTASEGLVQRMKMFLDSQGFKQQFEQVEAELQDCLHQLSFVLNTTHFAYLVGAVAAISTSLHMTQCTAHAQQPLLMCANACHHCEALPPLWT
jgi:hypothetical protein